MMTRAHPNSGDSQDMNSKVAHCIDYVLRWVWVTNLSQFVGIEGLDTFQM